MNKLKNYRKEIEQIDTKIISLLAHRKRILIQIDKYFEEKKKLGIEVKDKHIQKDPIAYLNKLKNKAKNKNLTPKYISKVWNEIEGKVK